MFFFYNLRILLSHILIMELCQNKTKRIFTIMQEKKRGLDKDTYFVTIRKLNDKKREIDNAYISQNTKGYNIGDSVFIKPKTSDDNSKPLMETHTIKGFDILSWNVCPILDKKGLVQFSEIERI
jgi:hypothetical protein